MLLSFTRAGRAAAGQDRRAPAGAPHVGHEHRRQARGATASSRRVPHERRPPRDARRDHAPPAAAAALAATEALHAAGWGMETLIAEEQEVIADLLRALRVDAGDFVT